MKYIIYELVRPDFLQKKEMDGYDLKTLERNVLERLNESYVYEEQDSFEDAVSEIQKNKDKLKFKQLVILPVISVDYNGDIS